MTLPPSLSTYSLSSPTIDSSTTPSTANTPRTKHQHRKTSSSGINLERDFGLPPSRGGESSRRSSVVIGSSNVQRRQSHGGGEENADTRRCEFQLSITTFWMWGIRRSNTSRLE